MCRGFEFNLALYALASGMGPNETEYRQMEIYTLAKAKTKVPGQMA